MIKNKNRLKNYLVVGVVVALVIILSVILCSAKDSQKHILSHSEFEQINKADLKNDLISGEIVLVENNNANIYSGASIMQIEMDGIGLAPNYINDSFSGILIMSGYKPQTGKRFFVSVIKTDSTGDDQLRWGTSDKSSNFIESSSLYYEET